MTMTTHGVRRLPLRQGRHREGLAPLMLFVTVVCAIPALFDLSREEAAIGLGALTLLPAITISARTGKVLIADPIIVIGAMWFLAVTLPVLVPLVDTDVYRDIAWQKVTPWAIDTAALWMYRGWAACCIGYWATRTLMRSVPIRHVSQSKLQTANRMRVLAGVVGLIGSCIFLVMTGGQSYTHLGGYADISSGAMVVGELKVFATIYIFLYFRARGRGLLLKWEDKLLYAILAAEAFIFAASSSKGMALEVGAAWILGSAAGTTRRNVLRELAIGAVALGFVYATFYVVVIYREEILQRAIARDAPIEEVVTQQFDALGVAVGGLINGRPIGYDDTRYDTGNMFDRMAHVLSFGMVLDYTGGFSPYENVWASLAAPVLAFIPRDLVGEKVIFMNSGTFAQLQGWEFGGISLSTAGSLFWAWGYEGIVLGMMSIGIILALLVIWSANDGPSSVIAAAMMLRIVIMMLDVGGDFQPLMANLMRTLAFMLVINIAAGHFRMRALR